MEAIEELKKDIAEMEKLASQASRSKVKDILSIEVRKLQTDLVKKQENLKTDNSSNGAPAKPASQSKPATRYTKTITTYAWDQSEKFMKIYVTLNGIDAIPADNVKADFTGRTAVLTVEGLGGYDHRCSIGRLSEDIVPGECYHKVKKDMVLLMLKKQTAGKTWAYVTEKEGKSKPAEPPAGAAENKEAGGDPQDNLMSMMKKMYDDGDDDMKRTIAEAWTKSQGGQGQSPL